MNPFTVGGRLHHMQHLFAHTLHHDHDVVTARQHASHVAALLGFEVSDQARIATAISEIVRNAFLYTGGGIVEFLVDGDMRPQRLVVEVRDRGPGISNLDEILAGRFRSTTGMGIGIGGARRLMDRFAIQSSPEGTTVVLEKFLPEHGELVTSERARHIAKAVETRPPVALLYLLQKQNQELLRAFDELHRRQQELVHLNRELEDTNRGVVALYAELDDKADHLRRADEIKSRFLSNITHEFRTPVNSILGLCNLLIEDAGRDGRAPGQELLYIRQAADQLLELVNDLLDLAKIEAGKTEVRPSTFHVRKLFGALRGMLRPLLVNHRVALVFEDAVSLPPLHTDEGKISQILRNLISNALKYTERGEVRVSARPEDAGASVVFDVSDTGIGIAPEDQHRIFEEFAQVEHRLQGRVRGTGLGLPLSRRLAELLGGSLTVRSTPGAGSTFTLTVPARYGAPGAAAEAPAWTPERGKLPLLVVKDALHSQYPYSKWLFDSPFQPYEAPSLGDAERLLETVRPCAIVLDVIMASQQLWDFVRSMKAHAVRKQVPIVIVSAADDEQEALAAGADLYLQKPTRRRTLLDTLTGLVARTRPPVRVLIVDDQQLARFVMRQCLPVPAFQVSEAASGEDALRQIRAQKPDVIVLDLVMPGMSGDELLEQLRRDPATADIPVVVATASELDGPTLARLRTHASAVLAKGDLTQTLEAAVRGLATREAPARSAAVSPKG